MLEFRHVSITLRKRCILSDITCRLRSGGITVLLGENGSGKSTLFRAVNREIAYCGEILLEGASLTALSRRERARRMALLPQVLPTPAMTVRELVSLGRTPHRGLLAHPDATDEAAVTRALERTALSAYADRPLATLSGGERQRAFLGMVLAQEARLLLLDEPTTYLDADARRSLLSLLRQIVREEGKTALLVLHDVNDALRIADEILLLDGGSTAFHGSRDRFLSEGWPERRLGLTKHTVMGDEIPFYY